MRQYLSVFHEYFQLGFKGKGGIVSTESAAGGAGGLTVLPKGVTGAPYVLSSIQKAIIFCEIRE